MAAWCSLVSPLLADQFGDFTYTDNGTSITITDYPTTAVGAVDIPASIVGKPVTAIGSLAFQFCGSLTSVAIPSGVIGIGDSAFQYCSSMTSVTIPGSVNAIGTQAFYGCSNLTSVAIPAGITIIAAQTFESCSKLTSVTIPDSVMIIQGQAFDDCISLTSVTIPGSVTSIETYAFSSCNNLSAITVDPSNTAYSSIDGVLFNEIQTILVQYPGGKTGNYAIPSGVTSIGVAFTNCKGLASVTIPGSMTGIGFTAFSGCTNLTNVTIPSSVTSIETQAFDSCVSLTSVTIPSSVTSIGSSAFYFCTSLTSMTIPASVTSIGSAVFRYCSSLTAITVAASNTAYSSSDGVLFNKTKTILVQYPGGKTGNYAIPSNVTSIGSAFQSCGSLTSVTIPSSVTTIGTSAFGSCTSLAAVTISSGVTSIGISAFSSCGSLTNVTIPSGVTSIAGTAFSSCSSLKSAVFFGDAPSVVAKNIKGASFTSNASGFTVYYFNGKAGFTAPTWQGYPSVNMGPVSPVAPWLLTNGFAYNASLTADPNNDGVSLLIAYALNLDPKQNLSGSLPKAMRAGSQMSLTFYAGSQGVTYAVEASADMQSWSTAGVTLSVPDINNFRTATVDASGPGRFLRVVAVY